MNGLEFVNSFDVLYTGALCCNFGSEVCGDLKSSV